MKILVLLTTLLIFGCSTSSDDTSSSTPSTGNTGSQPNVVASDNFEVSAEARALHPSVAFDSVAGLCDTSQSKPLVGCYVSETCRSIDSDSSQLFITSFTADGLIRSKILMFIDDASCSSTYLQVGLSALDLFYSVEEEITSSLGVMVEEIDAEMHVNAGALGTFVTQYISSYHFKNNRLCFPEGDYSWGQSGGGLFFSAEKGSVRPTDIDFADCLVRLN